jgi:hypothetical protein
MTGAGNSERRGGSAPFAGSRPSVHEGGSCPSKAMPSQVRRSERPVFSMRMTNRKHPKGGAALNQWIGVSRATSVRHLPVTSRAGCPPRWRIATRHRPQFQRPQPRTASSKLARTFATHNVADSFRFPYGFLLRDAYKFCQCLGHAARRELFRVYPASELS